MKKTTIMVKGMHCKSCALLISDKLAETVGVADNSVDFASGQTQITYDESKVSVETLKAAIKETGYIPE